MARRKRQIVYSLMLTDDERQTYALLAEINGMPLASLIRQMLNAELERRGIELPSRLHTHGGNGK